MKQLLIWCAKRASAPPPSNKIGGDGNAHAIGMIAHVELLSSVSRPILRQHVVVVALSFTGAAWQALLIC